MLIVLLAPVTWLRQSAPVSGRQTGLRYEALPLPPASRLAAYLGLFRLERAWRLHSGNRRFGNLSALLVFPPGEAMGLGDRGSIMRFSLPGYGPPRLGIVPFHEPDSGNPPLSDAESVTRDPQTGRIWIGWEGSNAITRHDPRDGSIVRVRPMQMRDWGANVGPEAMVRLRDGRFIVLREGYEEPLARRTHRALMFAGDPVANPRGMAFRFAGPPGYSPTDMAELPDGRVLILMRRLVWPFPLRFAGRIVLADPRDIKPGGEWRGVVVARLASSLPVDNFESLAIQPGPDGRLTIWLASDDNQAVTQATVLWRISLDPARLPRR